MDKVTNFTTSQGGDAIEVEGFIYRRDKLSHLGGALSMAAIEGFVQT